MCFEFTGQQSLVPSSASKSDSLRAQDKQIAGDEEDRLSLALEDQKLVIQHPEIS